MTRIGINGFGRIGRQTLKAMLERHPGDLEVVAINDLAPTATNAHLFKYDSTYGRCRGALSSGEGEITVGGHVITAFSERDPVDTPFMRLLPICADAWMAGADGFPRQRHGCQEVDPARSVRARKQCDQAVHR